MLIRATGLGRGGEGARSLDASDGGGGVSNTQVDMATAKFLGPNPTKDSEWGRKSRAGVAVTFINPARTGGWEPSCTVIESIGYHSMVNMLLPSRSSPSGHPPYWKRLGAALWGMSLRGGAENGATQRRRL